MKVKLSVCEKVTFMVSKFNFHGAKVANCKIGTSVKIQKTRDLHACKPRSTIIMNPLALKDCYKSGVKLTTL